MERGPFDVARLTIGLGDRRLHTVSLISIEQPKRGGSDERMQEVDPMLAHGDHSGVPDLVERAGIRPEGVHRGTQHPPRNAQGGDRDPQSPAGWESPSSTGAKARHSSVSISIGTGRG